MTPDMHNDPLVLAVLAAAAIVGLAVQTWVKR